MPVEPVTTFTILGTLLAVAAQGVWGNRADALVCRSLKALRQRLQGEFQQPINHDVARGVFNSFVQAIHDTCQDLLVVVVDGQDRLDLETLLKGLPSPSSHEGADQRLVDCLTTHINAVLSGPETATVPRGVVADHLTRAAVEWVESQIGRKLSSCVRQAFSQGIRSDDHAAAAWTLHYRMRLAEQIKNDERFRSIIDSQNLASIVENQADQRQSVDQILRLIAPADLLQFAELAATGGIEFVAEGTAETLGFSHRRSANDIRIKSGSGFQLRAQVPADWYAVVIEGFENKWVTVPLNGEYNSPYVLGNGHATLLPSEGLLESFDAGVHHFLVISVDPLLHSQLKDRLRSGSSLSNDDQKAIIELLDHSPMSEYLLSIGYMIVEP